MEHETLGAFVRTTVEGEVIPSLPYPAQEMKDYAEAVFERYLNPYIRHRLSDIAMNSISKFKVRLLPSLAYYAEQGDQVPAGMLRGLAGLVRYYKVKRNGEQYEGRSLNGQSYLVRDEAKTLETIAGIWADAELASEPLIDTVTRILSEKSLWGEDLTRWSGVTGKVTEMLADWQAKEERQ
jgi:tagaturonate reductase